MEDVGKIAVGGLELLAQPAWHFVDFSSHILGRRDGGVGVLQISTAFRSELPTDASPESAEQLARQWVGEGVGPFEAARVEGTDYGVASCGDGASWVWYLLNAGGLVLATYGPRAEASDRDRVEHERDEAAAIVRSISWRAG